MYIVADEKFNCEQNGTWSVSDTLQEMLKQSTITVKA
jgi:hypothetical protein